jgi:hypothetical protein
VAPWSLKAIHKFLFRVKLQSDLGAEAASLIDDAIEGM